MQHQKIHNVKISNSLFTMHTSLDIILSRSMTAFINKLKIDYKYKKIHAFLILVPISGE